MEADLTISRHYSWLDTLPAMSNGYPSLMNGKIGCEWSGNHMKRSGA